VKTNFVMTLKLNAGTMSKCVY